MLPVVIHTRRVTCSPRGNDRKSARLQTIRNSSGKLQSGLFKELSLRSLARTLAPFQAAGYRLPKPLRTFAPQHQYLTSQGIHNQQDGLGALIFRFHRRQMVSSPLVCLRQPDSNRQFPQLIYAHIRRGRSKQAGGSLGFGKSHDFADGSGMCEQHDQTV